MDPLTHALLGATAVHAAFSPRLGRRAWMLGALAGMLPDADVLISSASDPLLAIEYHRHFTHSFAFVPIGGALAATPWLLQKAQRADWRALLAGGALGYATHGLLDACTNYGTHLLWPFSATRTAWHWITTVGPLLTLLLLIGLVFAVRGQSRRPALIALTLGLAYVGVAAVQHERAADAQVQIAAIRGQTITRGEIFPTVGNPFIWRSLYLADGVLHTDRLRMLGSPAQWREGSQVPLLQMQDLSPAIQADARTRRDFERFNYFSAGLVARAVGDAEFIGDARYSLSTERFEPIWGLRFHPGQPQPTEWVDRTARNRIPLSDLWNEISGAAPGYRSLPR